MNIKFSMNQSYTLEVLLLLLNSIDTEESPIVEIESAVVDDIKEDVLQWNAIRERYGKEAGEIYLMWESEPLIYALYQKFMPEEADFQVAIARLKQLSAEEILSVAHQLLGCSDNQLATALALMDESALPIEAKWHWTQALIYPEKWRDCCCELLVNLEREYRPIYEKHQAEIEQYYQQWDLARVLEVIPIIDDTIAQIVQKTPLTLVLASPVIFNVVLIVKDKVNKQGLLLIGTRMERRFSEIDQVGQEVFSSILKILSDPTRYEILSMLSQQDMRAKDIAEKLSITPAAVSYHTSKLTAQNVIIVGEHEKDLRYKANKTILRTVIEKLQRDFEL